MLYLITVKDKKVCHLIKGQSVRGGVIRRLRAPESAYCPLRRGRDITAENGKKKMGRPLKTEEPKSVSLHLRITQSESDRIQKCSEKLGIPRTDTIMKGIELLEKEVDE